MNHFIEVGITDPGNKYALTIHTGSRNFGYKVCQYHQAKAKAHIALLNGNDKSIAISELKLLNADGDISNEELGRRIMALRSERVNVAPDLEYLEGEEMRQYLYDMSLVQMYAEQSRSIISTEIAKALDCNIELIASSVHNYVDPDDMILRKGAIRAYAGDTVVIPMNRTEGTYIFEVLKNVSERNYSLPHGAGRKCSRAQAREMTTQARADTMMNEAGVYSSFNPRDEGDNSYKDPNYVLNSISEIVRTIYHIVPILNIK